MRKFYRCLNLYLVAISSFVTLATEGLNIAPQVEHETRIGVILDQTSRPGKEAKVAIELAIKELNIKTSLHWVLYLQNSQNKPVHVATAAKELIDEHKVKAILGANTWQEASTIAEVMSDNESNHDILPVFLSLASLLPQQATDQWPFFIQAVPTQSVVVTKAIAALLRSLDARQVTLIYETSLSASVISHLYQAFRKTGSDVTHVLPLTPGFFSLDEELEALKKQKLKVFVVHTSLDLAVSLFQTAKKMGMTQVEYLWIATNEITDLFHSIDATMISSLKGMIGVKSYFIENTHEFLHFRKRFRQKFRFDYPEEEQDEPGIFAVQGYNAVKLLEKHLPENFHNWKPIPVNAVEIVNVIGKGYDSVYWTDGSGFSETVEDHKNGGTVYTQSIDNVGQALRLLHPWITADRRRSILENTSQTQQMIRVAVPCKSLFKKFVECGPAENDFDGFVVKVFEDMMKKMNQTYYQVPYNYSNYDDLIQDLYLEKYDAIAGDLTIIEDRLKLVNFTQPYTESGMEMIVPVRSGLSNQTWLFLKPFTPEMWWLIVVITTYNGFVIWLIERSHNTHLQGTIITQIGIILWLAFTYLFTLRVDKMHSNLSRMSVVAWLFVSLIIIQSYTASLASMLTAQRREPTVTSVEMLRNTNATVGYCNGSFINDYLKTVLGFEDIKIRNYSSIERYAEALNNKEIVAIFLEVPVAKIFLAQYCKSFMRTGKTFKVGGFGFAFARGFTRLADANIALMNITESGRLQYLENQYLNLGKQCVDDESSPNKNESLSFHSFRALFTLTGGTSTLALSIYIIMRINKIKKFIQEHHTSNIWQLLSLMRQSTTTTRIE
ncbi:hypothetical protein R6Q57_019177 [Mikania cordata]